MEAPRREVRMMRQGEGLCCQAGNCRHQTICGICQMIPKRCQLTGMVERSIREDGQFSAKQHQ